MNTTTDRRTPPGPADSITSFGVEWDLMTMIHYQLHVNGEATVDPMQELDVLCLTHAVLDHGWCRHILFRARPDGGLDHCLVGAVQAAVNTVLMEGDLADRAALYQSVVQRLHRNLPSRPGPLHEGWPRLEESAHNRLVHFNNEVASGRRAVQQLLVRAAAGIGKS